MASTSSSSSNQSFSSPLYTFGVPWPELNEGVSYTDVVKSIDSGKTLIDFYFSKYKSSAPLQGWLQRIKNRQISIDGDLVTDPESVLREGSEVVYNRLPWREPDAPYMLEVLYEDENMVAINKPSGLQVLPGGLFQQRTVLRQLQWRAWMQDSCCYSKNAAEEPHPAPVHRLGRGTSVYLSYLLAQASYFVPRPNVQKFVLLHILPRVRQLWRIAGTLYQRTAKHEKYQNSIERWLLGLLEKEEIVIKHSIGVMHYPGVATGLYVASPSGRPALSKVRVLERDLESSQTWVEVEIHSGRPHQIRIHLAFIGHPLFGDPLYDVGGHPKFCESVLDDDSFADDGGYHKPVIPVPGDCGYYLHAHRIIFCHPSTEEMVEIIAPLPAILRTRKELVVETS